MRKVLFAAAGLAALGAAGFAIAQDDNPRRERPDFFAADTNNDGAITRAEFDAAHAARFTQQDANRDGQLARDEMHRGRGGRGGHHRGGGMHHLTSADANNDGAITRDEFLARPLEHFGRLDTNNDGVISASERPAPRERGERREGQRRERHNPDANGDRQISPAEFASMGGAMFERMDANNDERITREEAQAAHEHRGRGRGRGGDHGSDHH